MKKHLLAAAVAAALTLSTGAVAFAAESETEEMRQEIAKLNAKLAQLEAKQNAAPGAAAGAKPKVNFFFDNRIQYNHTSLKPSDGGGYNGTIDQQGQFMERIRVYMNAQVGDKWEWNSRLHHTKWNLDGGDGTAKFDRFWLTNKDIAGGTLDIGRQGLFPGKAFFWNYVGDTDAVVYTTQFDKLTLKLGDGRNGGSGTGTSGQELRFAELSYRPDKKSDIGVVMLKHDNPLTALSSVKDDMEIFALNGAFEIPKTGLALAFEWGQNRADVVGDNPSGYYVALHSSYAGANINPTLATSIVNPFVKGSSGWAVSYRHMPTGMAGIGNRGAASMVPATTDVDGTFQNNFDDVNVWRADYIYVPWRNVQWTLTYEDIKPISGDWKNHSIQSVFNFFF